MDGPLQTDKYIRRSSPNLDESVLSLSLEDPAPLSPEPCSQEPCSSKPPSSQDVAAASEDSLEQNSSDPGRH